MIANIDSLAKIIRGMISQELVRNQGLQVFKVTDTNEDTYTVNIRHLNKQKIAYNDVQIIGLGMGDFKGTFKLPATDDLVLVGFVGLDSQTPVVLGSLIDNFTQSPDGVPVIQEKEYLLTNTSFGSIIFMSANNDIILKASNAGDLDGGAKLRINADGSFKLLNKDGYGIHVDSAGAMTIAGVTVNYTQTPITF